MPVMSVALLGPMQIIKGDGQPANFKSSKEAALLAYLIVESARAHRREAIAALLWPDAPESSARTNLRTALYRLRIAISDSAANPPYLLISADTIQFNPSSQFQLDVATFLQLGEACRTHPHDHISACEACHDRLLQAADLYHGDFLSEFYVDSSNGFEQWAGVLREKLQLAALDVFFELANYYDRAGDYARAIQYALRQLQINPWRESAHQQLMRFFDASGERIMALAQYEKCRRILADELGIEPSRPTTELYEQIRARDASQAFTDRHMTVPGAPPHNGLKFYSVKDAHRYFGREALARKLAARLEQHPFLAVVGASGSGKSSLVRAGLYNAIYRPSGSMPARPEEASPVRWITHIVSPEEGPLDSLANSLVRMEQIQQPIYSPLLNTTPPEDLVTHENSRRRLAEAMRHDEQALSQYVQVILSSPAIEAYENTRLLIIVDQFEEVFTACRDEQEREIFIANLLAASHGSAGASAAVVVAIRADYYSFCGRYPDLRQATAAHQEFIGAMAPDELKRAIEEPIKQGGWEMESGLLELVLSDLGNNVGGLPLLSHAMLETWLRRRWHILTVEGYRQSGGVRGAIAKTADTVFNSQLDEAQRALARNFLIRLTTVSDAGDFTRRTAGLNELITAAPSEDAARQVLNVLADSRLIVIGHESVSIAHDALIREWPQLGSWLAEDREGLLIHRHLTGAAHDWQELGEDADELYRGARLAQALEWAQANPSTLNALEARFLDESDRREKAQLRQAEEQQREQLRIATQLAESESRRADENRQTALQMRRRARYLLGTVIAAFLATIVAIYFVLSNAATANANAVLVTANAEIAATAQAGQATAEYANTLAASEALKNATQQAQIAEVAATAQAAFRTSEAQRLGAEANRLLQSGGNPEVIALLAVRSLLLEYNSQGDEAAVGALALHYSDAIFTGEALEGILSVAVSPDGKFIATAGFPSTAKLWDAATGQVLQTYLGKENVAQTSVVFSPDGSKLFTGSLDGNLRVWNTTTGELLRKLALHTDGIQTVAINPAGTQLATAGFDGLARVIDTASGEVLLTLQGHEGEVIAVAFSPDGQQLATGGADGTARIWEIASGNAITVLSGHSDRVLSVAFSPDGQQVLTGSYDNTARLWEAATATLSKTFSAHMGGVNSVAFSPDGAVVLTGGRDQIAALWDRQTGQLIRKLEGHTNSVNAAMFYGDGTTVVTASDDATLRLWPVAPQSAATILRGHTSLALSVTFSQDGRYLLTTSQDRTARLWHVTTGEQAMVFNGHADIVQAADISPDGRQVVTASWEGTDGAVRLWDVATGEVIAKFAHPHGALAVAFSPDGRTIASGGWDNTAYLWDAESGALLRTLAGHQAFIYGIAFSPDGQYVLTGSFDQVAKVWDVQSGALVQSLTGHTNAVTNVAFSGDGRYALTGSIDGTAKLWSVDSFENVQTYKGHTGIVWGVAVSPDGQYVLTGSDDKSVWLWDTLGGRAVRHLFGHSGAVESVTFSPDGKLLATASDDGTIRLWQVNYQDVVETLCRRLKRDLSDAERIRYNITDSAPGCAQR